jgi:hypothetical protein
VLEDTRPQAFIGSVLIEGWVGPRRLD